GAVPGAVAQTPELAFVAPETIVAELTDEKSDEVSVWIKNTAAQEVTPEFETVLENSSGEPVPAKVEVGGGGITPIPASKVGRYRLYLTKASKSSGQLVVTAPGVAPASIAVSAGPKLALGRGVAGALLIPLFAALIVLVGIWAIVHGEVKLTDPLGGLELDFSKSFASTLTAVGALLGTIISAGVLSEETVKISKAGFTGLNLTFAIAIAVAGIVYAVWQDVVPEKGAEPKEWKLQGHVLPFLVAALITLWAVIGEGWTLWLLLGELGADDGFTSLAVWIGRSLLIVAAFAMVPYTESRIKLVISKNPPPAKGKPAEADAIQAEPLRPVSLL
ncbi:MAG TPA: hypothetical protein VIY71_03485, partial [Solirubrobacterales bacterium]